MNEVSHSVYEDTLLLYSVNVNPHHTIHVINYEYTLIVVRNKYLL